MISQHKQKHRHGKSMELKRRLAPFPRITTRTGRLCIRTSNFYERPAGINQRPHLQRRVSEFRDIDCNVQYVSQEDNIFKASTASATSTFDDAQRSHSLSTCIQGYLIRMLAALILSNTKGSPAVPNHNAYVKHPISS